MRDLATVATVAPDRLERLQADAREWQDFNQSVIQPLRERDFLLRPDERTTEEVIEGMAQSYIITGSPGAALSGNATQILILMMTTLGGALLLAINFGYVTFSVSQLRAQVNRFKSAESEEGELADRKADLALQERTSTAAGTGLADLPEIDDYWAQTLGDAHGQDLATAWESILAEHWGGILTDWLTVMTQQGYRVVGEGDAVEVVDENGVYGKRNREVGELTAAELSAIDADEPPISTFEPDVSAIDWEALGEDTVVLDLDQWAEEWDLGIDHDADVRAYGDKLVTLCEAVETAEFTDEDGAVRPDRAYLNAYQRLTDGADQHNLPGAPMLRELLQAALRHRSPREKTEQTVEDIRSGRYSAGDD